MSLQITFFPNNGFSIGVITNHVVTDGKTTTMFMKSWASICKLNLPTPPSELTPVFDRTTTKDPTQLDKLYAKYFPMFISSTSQEKKLKLRPKVTISDDVMSGTFELSNDDIKNLRKKVATSEKRHLSTFVLTYAYVSTCMIKAQQIEGKNKVGLGFLVDCRSRSEFPTPVNYFGNGITGRVVYAEAREFEGENGFVNISTKLSDAIVELEEKMKKKAIVEFMEEVIIQWEKEMPVFKIIAVAGSPRFGVYGIDFGCGSCKKVEMTSLNPGEAISISDSREGNGGVQVGIALPKDDINVFASLFSNQLK